MMKNTLQIVSVFALATLCSFSASAAADRGPHTSSPFKGPKANTGTVQHTYENGKNILRVSPDFKVPDTPAPTWRVVDSKGNIHTLDAFKVQGGERREIKVPAYVKDVVKVQVFCAWAQKLLGEASFGSPAQ
jgi:hypothetical protein